MSMRQLRRLSGRIECRRRQPEREGYIRGVLHKDAHTASVEVRISVSLRTSIHEALSHQRIRIWVPSAEQDISQRLIGDALSTRSENAKERPFAVMNDISSARASTIPKGI